jgi:hypothetical protein
MNAADDPYVAHHQGLVAVHGGLLSALAQVADAPLTSAPDLVVTGALAAGQFLLGHHAAEDTVLFPGLRRSGRLRSSDAAFLDACDGEHRAIHGLCDRLIAQAQRSHPGIAELIHLAGEVRQALAAHVAREETGLAPGNLRLMVTREQLDEIGREIERMRARGWNGG